MYGNTNTAACRRQSAPCGPMGPGAHPVALLLISRCVLWLAASTAVLLAGGDAKAQGLDQTGVLWEPPVEWSLNNSTFSGNPFDLDASGTFTHADTETGSRV